MTRRRGLTPEDRALWRAATRDASPLPPDLRGAPIGPEPGAPAQPPGPQPGRRTGKASPGKAAPSAAPSLPPKPAAPPRVTVDRAPPALDDGPDGSGMDRRTALRLRRGRIEPEARIDLHGMSAERAHPALQQFIGQALGRGLRLVLVITGKGGARTGPGPDAPFMLPPPGLLRRQAPRWLRAGPHGSRIVGMWPAHARHGGAGAIYVYLKKRR